MTDTRPVSRPPGDNNGPVKESYPPAALAVDGERPGVAWVAALPRSYKLRESERLVLLAIACDSYDGYESAPGMDDLAAWCGLLRGSLYAVVARLEKPTAHRPALLERESTGGRNRTVLRLLRDDTGRSGERSDEPSGVNGRLGADNRPFTPDGWHKPNRPGNRPVTPDDNGPQPSGEPSDDPSGDTGPTLSLTQYMHASEPSITHTDEPAAPTVDDPVEDQLAAIRTRQVQALEAVILDQPHGERLHSRTRYAHRLRDAGWTPATLTAEFTVAPLIGAQGAGLLRSRLEPLITSGPPPEHPTSNTRSVRSVCPVPGHGAFTGACAGCAGDHNGGEHRDQPSPACHRCADAPPATTHPDQEPRRRFQVIQGGKTA